MISTWRCDACGRERPDREIDVLSYGLKGLPDATRNFRYCADDDECHRIARERAKAGEV